MKHTASIFTNYMTTGLTSILNLDLANPNDKPPIPALLTNFGGHLELTTFCSECAELLVKNPPAWMQPFPYSILCYQILERGFVLPLQAAIHQTFIGGITDVAGLLRNTPPEQKATVYVDLFNQQFEFLAGVEFTRAAEFIEAMALAIKNDISLQLDSADPDPQLTVISAIKTQRSSSQIPQTQCPYA